MIATWGCVEEHWDSSIKCYGDLSAAQNATESLQSEAPEAKFSCLGGSDAAFSPLWTYMSGLCDQSDSPHKGQSTLWMAQAHWQYDTSSVVQGEAHNSCILEDESKAGVNKQIAERISQGHFQHLNLLEVDNVCDHGVDILAAMRARFNYDYTDAGTLLVNV